jgi:hypothetical protein
MRRFVVLASAAAAIAAWSSTADAGLVSTFVPKCVDTANGGYCVGTFKGARASADANFGVEFDSDIYPDQGGHIPTLTFIATFTKNGVNSKRLCSATNSWTQFAQNEGLAAVLRAEDYFYVSWDTTGTCSAIVIATESDI